MYATNKVRMPMITNNASFSCEPGRRTGETTVDITPRRKGHLARESRWPGGSEALRKAVEAVSYPGFARRKRAINAGWLRPQANAQPTEPVSQISPGPSPKLVFLVQTALGSDRERRETLSCNVRT